jgi:hypothetical protein
MHGVNELSGAIASSFRLRNELLVESAYLTSDVEDIRDATGRFVLIVGTSFSC